jgi:hypothetical protein
MESTIGLFFVDSMLMLVLRLSRKLQQRYSRTGKPKTVETVGERSVTLGMRCLTNRLRGLNMVTVPKLLTKRNVHEAPYVSLTQPGPHRPVYPPASGRSTGYTVAAFVNIDVWWCSPLFALSCSVHISARGAVCVSVKVFIFLLPHRPPDTRHVQHITYPSMF